MRNVVVLYKNEDDYIVCRQLSEKGIESYKAGGGDEGEGYWEEGGTILLNELEEILDKEI